MCSNLLYGSIQIPGAGHWPIRVVHSHKSTARPGDHPPPPNPVRSCHMHRGLESRQEEESGSTALRMIISILGWYSWIPSRPWPDMRTPVQQTNIMRCFPIWNSKSCLIGQASTVVDKSNQVIGCPIISRFIDASGGIWLTMTHFEARQWTRNERELESPKTMQVRKPKRGENPKKKKKKLEGRRSSFVTWWYKFQEIWTEKEKLQRPKSWHLCDP